MERVVICDFDGTLIKENIENAFTRFLLSFPKYRIKLIIVALFTLPLNLILNRFHHSSILKSWTWVLGKDTDLMINLFLKDNNHLLTLNTQTIELLNELEYDKCILLTGSYSCLVQRFIDINKISCFDKIVGSEVYSNKLFVKQHPYGHSKCDYLDAHNYNIGIANDFSDHFYMDMCDEKYWIS